MLRTRARLAFALLAGLTQVAVGRCPQPGLAIASPAPGVVLLGPEVEVRLRLQPPLLRQEQLRAWLDAGLDSPSGSWRQELSDDVVLARGRRAGRLLLSQLPPGRSRLTIERTGPGRGRAPALPFAGRVERMLDRGGFFPDAEGPFGAGVSIERLRRVRDDGALRELDLYVWFPTRDDREPDPVLRARVDAELAPGAAALPTLLFSHGNCGLPTHYAIFLARLARAGWVAAAMTHPGNTREDPACDSLGAQIQAFTQRPADVIASLDWLLDQSADPRSRFAGAVDPERLALAGHSFGALTTVLTAPQEPRFRALLPMAPVFAPIAGLLGPILPLARPVMLQVGSLDQTTPLETDAGPLYDRLAPPRFLLELEDAGHPVFEDFCATPLPGVCPAGAHDRIAELALGFLGASVAEDLRWADLLESAPGALLTADP